MSYSVLTLKSDLTGIIHGTSLSQIQNLNGVINRAARQVLMDVDPQETKRTVEFVNPIFNTVFDYPIADDVKGNAIIDIFPSVQRLPRDIWTQAYNQAFDVAKQNVFSLSNMFTMNFNSGLKSIRINAPFLNAPVILNQVNSITNNGTWALTGDASNLLVDYTNFATEGGSLEFTLNANAANCSITNPTMSAINLSAQEFQSSLFYWIYFSDSTNIDFLQFRFGSDASDFWYKTNITTNQQGNSFVNGWNLIEVPWDAVLTIGSPVATAINYIQISVKTVASTQPAQILRINQVASILGTVLNYEYYSKFLFRDAITGGFQETTDDDSNLINLDTDSYNLLLYKTAELAVQQQQGLDAAFYDGNFLAQAYQDNLVKYKSKYKSEKQKPQSIYYQKPNPSYRNWQGGNRWNY